MFVNFFKNIPKKFIVYFFNEMLFKTVFFSSVRGLYSYKRCVKILISYPQQLLKKGHPLCIYILLRTWFCFLVV